MNKIITGLIFSGFILMSGCQSDSNKNVEYQVVKVDNVELYPKYYNCEDFYEKDQQLDCLMDRFNKFVYNSIQTHYADDFLNMNDTLWVQFSIDSIGETHFVQLSSQDTINNAKFDSIFDKIAQRVPKMEPAIFQDKPVEFNFKIPIIISTNETE